jgi:phenylacetaldehyde dehydrogenase
MTHQFAASTTPPAVSSFLTTPHGLFIDGQWVAPLDRGELEVFEPSTGARITTVAAAGPADVDRAVAAARAAFEGPWSRTRPAERTRLLWRLAGLVEQHAEEFAVLESLDVGKPLTAARAGDVPGAIAVLRYFAGWADKLEGCNLPLALQPGGEFHAFTVRAPVGVCAQIIPWNYPLVMAVWKLAPALACGCTVVLKPAEETPLSALRLAELIDEAGFPPGTVNIVCGVGEVTGAALARHPGVDKIAFTGSTEVGKLIAHAAADGIKRVSLELGGKSANIVFADADLGAAIPGSARAIFTNAGQSCGSGSRIFIEEPVYDEVVSGLIDEAKKLRVGGGLEDGSELGPIISPRQRDRISGYVDQAAQDGATIECGGRAPDRPGWFYLPTIVTAADPSMPIVREEVFGPVLVAAPFRNIDEALTLANQSRYGLAGGAWTRDINKVFRVTNGLRVGRLYVNCWAIIDPTLPVGGFKESGVGREMGHGVLDLYTEVKAACIRVG